MPFDMVREKIAAYLVEAVRRRASAQYVAILAGRSNIVGIDSCAPPDLDVNPMLLGQLIRDLSDEGEAAEALRGLGDLPLLARVEQAAQALRIWAPRRMPRWPLCVSPTRRATTNWLALMTALERADDPGVACARWAVWALGQDKASPCKHAAGAAQKRQAGG